MYNKELLILLLFCFGCKPYFYTIDGSDKFLYKTEKFDLAIKINRYHNNLMVDYEFNQVKDTIYFDPMQVVLIDQSFRKVNVDVFYAFDYKKRFFDYTDQEKLKFTNKNKIRLYFKTGKMQCEKDTHQMDHGNCLKDANNVISLPILEIAANERLWCK
ncbi:hypothetical protein [Flexithrix dorotheae]|uniref:hypothetical protein n=1 Tax=Flexithrix dorotheae TaxID=70993 RepID=UPI0003731D93|nr:hypothetical protein [Flexithrix dorotheae]